MKLLDKIVDCFVNTQSVTKSEISNNGKRYVSYAQYQNLFNMHCKVIKKIRKNLNNLKNKLEHKIEVEIIEDEVDEI